MMCKMKELTEDFTSMSNFLTEDCVVFRKAIVHRVVVGNNCLNLDRQQNGVYA